MIDQQGVQIIVGFTAPVIISGLTWVGVYELVANGKLELQRHDIKKALNISKVQIEDHEKAFEKIKRVHREENKEFMDCLSKFEKFLYNKPHINKEFYNKNISEATILFFDEKTEEKFKKGKWKNPGRFMVRNGKLYIELIKDVYKENIYHELLHLASNYLKDSIKYTGFFQYNMNTGFVIGHGINEGFTVFLDRKYFNDKSEVYEELYTIVEKLTNIIGQKKMETLYFNADLNGLINEIIKYGFSKEEVYKFIINMDLVYKIQYIYNKNTKNGVNNLVKCLDEINKFLVKLFVNKKVMDDSKQNKEELKKDTKEFIVPDFFQLYVTSNSKDNSVFIRNKKFSITTNEQMKKYIDDTVAEAIQKESR